MTSILCRLDSLESKVASLSYPRVIFTLNAVEGFRARTWGPRDDRDGTAVEDFEFRWGGAPVNGVPTHTDGASNFDLEVLETDTRFSPAERGQDEHELCYNWHNKTNRDIEITDTDGRAESIRVYVGCPCDMKLTYERYQDAGGPYSSNGEVIAVIPANSHCQMKVLIHDPGPDFSGFRPNLTFAGVTTPADSDDICSYQSWPTVTYRVVDQLICEAEVELEDNESYLPISVDCNKCPSGSDGDDNGDGDGDELAVSEEYVIRQWQDNGFFNTNQMNGQIQVFNTSTTPGPVQWELRFDANYDITSLTPSVGTTAGAIQKINNGATFGYIIPMTTVNGIPGNNGNVQIGIVGTRKAGITDTQASHSNEMVYT